MAVQVESNLYDQGEICTTYIKDSIAAGTDWHIALLKAIGMWTIPVESWRGCTYAYVIGGEAFDWILLAQRLSADLTGIIPPSEYEPMIFYGCLPEGLTSSELKQLVGFNKYRLMLNYWYGVVVEEAIQLSVENEVRKETVGKGVINYEYFDEEMFHRIYGSDRMSLLAEFRDTYGVEKSDSIDLTGIKEFTYWLFKRRLRTLDPARVASDTRKGLKSLKKLLSGNRYGEHRVFSLE